MDTRQSTRKGGFWRRLPVVLGLVVCIAGCGVETGCAVLAHIADFLSRFLGAQSSGPVSQESSYGRLPLTFERNFGQADPRYEFLAYGAGYTLFLSSSEAVFDLRDARSGSSAVVSLRPLGARGRARAEPGELLQGRVNYFIGNDPSLWVTDVPTFRRVYLRGVWEGIDVVYYGRRAQLEFDCVVGPGADPGAVRFSFAGADQVEIEAGGQLRVRAAGHELRWQRPRIYQTVGQVEHPIEGGFELTGRLEVGFRLGPYDRRLPLVIDPVVSYASYLGRQGDDAATRVAVDSAGNAYVAGFTGSANFPVTPGALPGAGNAGNGNALVSKINAAGTALVYSTHIGGAITDVGLGIAVDSEGNAYLAGGTTSANFPVTQNAFQSRPGGTAPDNSGDCFVVKLNPAGNALVYSTYLGGGEGDACFAIAVDAAGSAYLTGSTLSRNFPTTEGAFGRTYAGSGTLGVLRTGDAFVAKINPAGTALLYSTLLGGSGDEGGLGIAVDSGGNAYVAGFTTSANFPVTTGAFQTTFGGLDSADGFVEGDGFAVKLNPAGTALVYATYLGGRQDDAATAIAVDAQGNAYLTGQTLSPNFPTTAGAFRTAFSGAGGDDAWRSGDAFATKLNAAGSALLYSSFLGGTRSDRGMAIAVDRNGSAFVAGHTLSRDFPLTSDAAQSAYRGEGGQVYFRGGDAFLTQFNPAGSALVYSTLFGGSGDDAALGLALDSTGAAYMSGSTTSPDLRSSSGALQQGYADTAGLMFPFGDGFVVKYADAPQPPAGPQVTVTAVASAASYAGGGVAPGEIIIAGGARIGPERLAALTLTPAGAVSTLLAETRFLFDGVPAPLVYVSDTQSSAIVPFAVAGRASTQLVVEFRGQRSAPLTIPVLPSKPGLFAADASGRGQGAILNQDGSRNSPENPADKGTVIVLFGTGAGQTDPPGTDGRLAVAPFPRPTLPVSVAIGEVSNVQVLYVGAAPGLVEGVFQLNALVPPNAPSGNVPVRVTIGSATSQAGLTVAIR